MKELIEALKIFSKYTEDDYPTHCEHEVLYVLVDPDKVSKSDKEKLDSLDFFISNEYKCFASYRYG